MKTIHKVMLEPQPGVTQVQTPKGAHFLTAQMMGPGIALWFHCDTEAEVIDRNIMLAWTGTSVAIPMTRLNYIATVQNGPLVYHVMEVTVMPPQVQDGD